MFCAARHGGHGAHLGKGLCCGARADKTAVVKNLWEKGRNLKNKNILHITLV